MTTIAQNIRKSLRLLARTTAITAVLVAPVLAVPSLRGDQGATIEAPAQKNMGAGLVILVSLQRA